LHWQDEIKNSITSIEKLSNKGFSVKSVKKPLAMRITPHILSIMDKDVENCPIGRQFVPCMEECIVNTKELEDPVCENPCIKDELLVHAYDDRGLIICSLECPTYCRYCFRKRLVGDHRARFAKNKYLNAIQYLRDTPQIHEVILSGGDPLMRSDSWLDWLLSEIEKIESVKVIRIHTRVLSTLPSRITKDLCNIFKGHSKLKYLNTQINHPKEITQKTIHAISMLRKTGISIGNHSVLLKGVNDNIKTLKGLCLGLYHAGVIPYYLFHADYTPGISHFRTTIKAGMELHHKLQGWISGVAVPVYAFDTPRLRKVWMNPSYVKEIGKGRYKLTNFRGETMIYDENDLIL
jgi:lysine 2,3-aminomutase